MSSGCADEARAAARLVAIPASSRPCYGLWRQYSRCRHSDPVQIADVEVIHELLATRVAAEKLGARAISIDETQQLIDNRYVIVRNTGRGRRHERELARRLVIGRSVRFSGVEMTQNPWTASDPQPGDFDDDLAATDPRDVQVVEAGSGGRVTIVVSVEGEDAKRLERIAAERGKGVDEVVADRVRNA